MLPPGPSYNVCTVFCARLPPGSLDKPFKAKALKAGRHERRRDKAENSESAEFTSVNEQLELFSNAVSPSAAGQDQRRFMASKNSIFVLVSLRRSIRNSVAAVSSMGLSSLRRIHMRCISSSEAIRSSRRVPERRMLIAG